MRVFIAGATGAIGARLADRLTRSGYEVVALSRSAAKARSVLPLNTQIVEGNPTQAGSWQDAIDGCTGVINLTGESVFAKRWSAAVKQELQSSRINSTRAMVDAIARAQTKPEVFINASAIGYYGDRDDEDLSEAAGAGHDFLARLCVAWEEEALRALEFEQRVVLLRTGVVLAAQSGALKQMLPIFKHGFGGKIGSGRQWVSWIHIDDAAALVQWALEHKGLTGPLNLTAPNPVRNGELAETLAACLGKRLFLPTPELAVRLALGERADMVLNGQKVLPAKAQREGFAFTFPRLDGALKDLIRRS